MQPPMFEIKICGIRTVEHALCAVEAGADAIGLNFFRDSVRRVTEGEAVRIAEAVAGRAARVGVFVNHDAEEIQRLSRDVPLDWVQLHGDEPPGYLPGLPVIRAFRCAAADLPAVDQHCQSAAALGAPLRAVLLDAPGGSFGGSGELADWDAARSWNAEVSVKQRPPMILAGGLTSENVRAAVKYVRPAAVDTASGVESARGVKDAARIAQFVKAAREALDAIA